MKDEAFGIIPLKKQEGEWFVFIVHRAVGFWEFPKGHAEGHEQPQEAAKRELQEETGLQVVKFLLEDPLSIHYTFLNKHQQEVNKTAYYFLAEVTGEPIFLQPYEVVEGKWVHLKEAEKRLTFTSSQELCSQVVKFLKL